ncbi:hypothetical protein UCRPC4_g00213 [Phaeomoniella chlamydospora]|uniref:Stress-associated endoplasmic reticulum protein n=1 Tax=Phaeomoniella chlamydospora TaxID=158046 RepID=A0A0G2F441_PHACM|nr:hypothetical protein UCRPC4_g00213 [Phaeomoniella chlamydospora]
MAQTPQQRRANAKYAKSEEEKRGKPASLTKKKQVEKPPISKGWIILLAFVVCGSVVFELGALFPKVWEWIAGTFSALFGSK